VRGVYIYQASHGRRTSALLSIFIDRLIGLTAFVVFGVAATLTRPASGYGVFEYSIFVFAALFALGIVVVFAYGHRIAQFVNRLFTGRSQRIASIIDDAGEALHQYAQQWRSVLLCLVISLAIVFIIALTVVIIADATEFGGLSAVEYGIAGVYAMIANSLPFTPGGLGIGEGAFASACVALEPTITGIPYGTIFLVLRVVIVLSSLPGLFVYLFYPHRATLLAPAKAVSPQP
jgi:glycosyltransferase 2 family protein